MGRDNHPKARRLQALARKKAKRAAYDRVLIVCEGEKTETSYFKEIRQAYRLATTNVEIWPRKSDSPLQIVLFAEEKCRETCQWEHVYCVFDRDDHASFSQALKQASTLDKAIRNDEKEPIRFSAIPSIPCFELWLLLHFDFVGQTLKSKETVRLLDQPGRLPGYEKGKGDHFEKTRHLLETAYEHADRLKADRQRDGGENPQTDVQVLVRHLLSLARR